MKTPRARSCRSRLPFDHAQGRELVERETAPAGDRLKLTPVGAVSNREPRPRPAAPIPDEHRGDNLRDQLFVKVFTVARLTIDRTWRSREVCSGYWRLYLNDAAGAGLELADGSLYPLVPGRVHFVPAGVRFSCRNTRPLRHLYIHFDLIGLTAVTVQRLFTKPLTLPPRPALAAQARQLDTWSQGLTTVCQAKALVHASLAELFRRLPPATVTLYDRLTRAQGPVAAAIGHIEDHLGSGLTNQQLAGLCHFSEDHFGRLFRQRLGQTPAQYILERRIAAATHWLAFSTASIDQIAERLGFANRFHFTRMFTRRMGCGPATYRRQTRV